MRFTFPLKGPGGEPVDLIRTFNSHGVASLPPQSVPEGGRELVATLQAGRVVRTLRVTSGPKGQGVIEVMGRKVSDRAARDLRDKMLFILHLDEDLSDFYRAVADDPDLAWAAAGAGRMIRSASAFEDVVKTVCTTNCSWSATERMVAALVQHLGAPGPGAKPGTWEGRAFPTPTAMAEAPESFYREVVRAGYRGPYFIELSRMVSSGEVDLEAWAGAPPAELPDEELALRLQTLPGVGPYAAAHIMMMIGRYSLLILDSWTRPTYARLVGRKRVSDAAITRRFRRYGRFAGLAFWLFLTRSWVPDPAEETSGA